MQTKVILGIGALGLTLAASAFARPHHPQLPISIEEAQSRTQELFSAADSNADGDLTREEFAAAKLPHGPRHRGPHPFGAMGEEHREAIEAELFDTLDVDGDGMLSRAEASRENRQAARRAAMKQRAFARLDADGNGVVSQEEFAQRLERLRALDENADGEVSRDEFRSGMRARHHAG